MIPRAGLMVLPISPIQSGFLQPSLPYPKVNGEPNLAQLTSSVTPNPNKHPMLTTIIPRHSAEDHFRHCVEDTSNSNATMLISTPSTGLVSNA